MCEAWLLGSHETNQPEGEAEVPRGRRKPRLLQRTIASALIKVSHFHCDLFHFGQLSLLFKPFWVGWVFCYLILKAS